MKAGAVVDTDRSIDQGKLKYVTEHFHSMGGLTWVAFGAFNILAHLRHLRPDSWLVAYAWPLVLLAVVWFITLRIQRYYRSRFGWVKPLQNTPSNRQTVIFLLLFLVLLFFGRYIVEKGELLLGFAQETTPRAIQQILSFPVLLWSFFLSMSFRRHPSREDWFRICFFSSGLLAWAIFALYPLSHPDLARSLIWKTVDYESLFISLITLGLYEHLTLVRLLPKRIEEGGNEEPNNG